MLNIIWPIMIIVSIIYSIIVGKVDVINNAIFDSTKKTIELILILIGTLSLWNGIIEIAKETKLIKLLTKFVSPLINLLFKESKNKKEIKEDISMNIIANMLGIGNAATPLGIKAMKDMQLMNNDKSRLTDDMATFIILNTASIQIIPTTVIAIRISLGSSEPTKIIFCGVVFHNLCCNCGSYSYKSMYKIKIVR